MITEIQVRLPEYHDFTMSQLTKNNLIFFSTPALKNKVAAELEKIWLLPDDGDDSLIYGTETMEEELALDTTKRNVRFLPTTMMHLTNGQKFVFTTEPAFLYAAKDWYDIWFVIEDEGKIRCYAFCEFIGAKETWNKGLDEVYAEFVQGKYGCYTGYKNINKGEYTRCRD